MKFRYRANVSQQMYGNNNTDASFDIGKRVIINSNTDIHSRVQMNNASLILFNPKKTGVQLRFNIN